MSDPRLNGCHLNVTRCDHYNAAVDKMLDDRGPATAEADPLVRPPSIPRESVRRELPPVRPPSIPRDSMHRESPPTDGTYALVSLVDGRRHVLRVGINTIGRFPENDLVLGPIYISRRHCVVLVHATGRCEVYDTASRHGTWVNRRRVDRVDLFPGDQLMLCNQKFLVARVGLDGGLFESAECSETNCIGDLSSTGSQSQTSRAI